MKIAQTHSWKELKDSSRVTMYSCIISEGLNNPKALHWACWKAAAFQLPLAQQVAAGWWALLPAIPELQLRDFMPSTASSSNFQVMRQQRTMALAWVLPACTEESGFLAGVLCDSAWELQKCMAPLLAHSRDEIVEASILRPIGEEHGTSPTPEEEAALLGKVKLPQVPEWLKVHKQVHPAEEIAAPTATTPSLLSNQVTPLPRRQRSPSKGSKWMQSVLPSGSILT